MISSILKRLDRCSRWSGAVRLDQSLRSAFILLIFSFALSASAQTPLPPKLQQLVDFPWNCVPGGATSGGQSQYCYDPDEVGDRAWAFFTDSARFQIIRAEVGGVVYLPRHGVGVVRPVASFVFLIPDSLLAAPLELGAQVDDAATSWAIMQALFGEPDSTAAVRFRAVIDRIYAARADTLRMP